MIALSLSLDMRGPLSIKKKRNITLCVPVENQRIFKLSENVFLEFNYFPRYLFYLIHLGHTKIKVIL